MSTQEEARAHIEIAHMEMARQQREGMVGAAACDARAVKGAPTLGEPGGITSLTGASQWSDHGILREMEALADKFAHGTHERAVLNAAWKRLGSMMDEVQRHQRESRRAGALQKNAEDRVRLALLALQP